VLPADLDKYVNELHPTPGGFVAGVN
jgi:hypothetical protein